MSTAGIQRGVPGTFVYLINADSTVSVRPVKLGVTDGDRVEVLSGLAPGDRIVIDGADKLRDGAKINMRSEADPTQAAPAQAPARPAKKSGGGKKRRSEGGQQTMNPSQPFILRPVATTLLMIAIMLSGMLAFRFLPVAALPEVDYPTIQVQTFYPGASPDVMTSSVTAPLEVQFGQMPNLNQMSSISSAGASVITLQFGLTISLDVAEQEVQAAINAAGNLLARRPARAADLRQGQPGRRADPDARPDLEDHAADAGRGLRRHAPGAEDLAASRRRPRQHQRRPAAGGAHPGRHPQACRLRPQHRRSAHHARQRQRQHAEGQFRRRDARLHHQCQRPDPQCRATTNR